MTVETHEHTITPGQLLTAAREARGLSQADISKQTRLSLQVVHDIERNEYARIGVRTFVRGYLCSFARLVGISEKQILASFDASGLMQDVSYVVLPSIEGAPVLNVTHQQRSARVHYARWIILGVGVFLVVGAFIGWKMQKNAMLKPLAADVSTQTSAVALSQPSMIVQNSMITIPKAALMPSTAAKITTKTKPVIAVNEVKKYHALNSKNDGFVIKPQTNLHPSYTISPAT